MSNIQKICEHISKREISSSRAERASIKFKQTEFLLSKVGLMFTGIVTGVKKWGVYIEILENGCEGMVGKSLFTSIDEDKHLAILPNDHTIKLGDEVMVRIDSVSLLRKEVDLSII